MTNDEQARIAAIQARLREIAQRARNEFGSNYLAQVSLTRNDEVALCEAVDHLAALARLQAERDEAQRSLALCEIHAPDRWEGDGTCVICEGVHLKDSLVAAEVARDEYRTLAKIGTWHDSCRPNREMAARELAKSQAVIDKLADRITELEATRAEAQRQLAEMKSNRG